MEHGISFMWAAPLDVQIAVDLDDRVFEIIC